RIARHHFTCHGLHEELLILHTGVVTIGEIPTTCKSQSLIAIETDWALLKSIIIVGERPRVVDLDPSESIGNVFETIEIHDRNVINALVNNIFNGLNRKWDATMGHGSIDL